MSFLDYTCIQRFDDFILSHLFFAWGGDSKQMKILHFSAFRNLCAVVFLPTATWRE